LIDAKGHVKLTDFGLSRVGFLGRRAHGLEMGHTSPNASLFTTNASPRPLATQPSRLSELLMSGGNMNHNRRGSVASNRSSVSEDSPVLAGRLDALLGGDERIEKFVGTPDYLAPESILGICQDASVDWWALGVMMYEFLYGFPPFNAGTPEAVFSNILSRNIDWHEGEIDVSVDARDLMERLMNSDHLTRLGSDGAWAVKGHGWFQGINWETILTEEAFFIPRLKGSEDTDYFDPRGLDEVFPVEEPEIVGGFISPASRTSEGNTSDFGDFVYKNLPLLERANNDVVRTLSFGSEDGRRSSISGSPKSKSGRLSKISSPILIPSRPSFSVIASPRSDGEAPMSGSQHFGVGKATLRVIEEGSGRARRNSLPSRFLVKPGATTRPTIILSTSSPTSSNYIESGSRTRLVETPSYKLDVLLVGIGLTDLGAMLEGWGCRCVVAVDGEEGVVIGMGSIPFHVMFIDTSLSHPVNGVSVAKMVRGFKKVFIVGVVGGGNEDVLGVIGVFDEVLRGVAEEGVRNCLGVYLEEAG
jgi:serine/threonine-protein kinase RIM15